MPEATSAGVQQDKIYEENKKYDAKEIFDEALAAQRDRILRRAIAMRDTREQPHRKFDNMTYTQDYQANEDAALTYLTPKKNKIDVRVNTATTEKKLDVFVNELISSNIAAEVRAHDIFDDEEIEYLGKDIGDMVTRTNEMEHEDDVLEDMYRELISQRALFFQEVAVTRLIGTFKKFKVKRLEKRLVKGTDVYLGDITKPAYKFHEQPDIIRYRSTTYTEARTIFGDNPNWKYVKKGGTLNSTLDFSYNKDTNNLYSNFHLNSIDNEAVEIIRYYSYPNQEYQVYVAGIPMEPVNAELPYKWEGYDIGMIVVKSLTDFAYGKPPVASAKSLQALENETLRNFIYKTRQSLTPPTGSMGKKVYSADVWAPGAITQGVTKNTFSKLIDHDGVTTSEMQMYGLINSIVEEFIGVSKEAQGLGSGKSKTATATLTELRRSLKNMAYVIAAATRLRVATTEKRIYSIMSNMLDPVGKKLDPFTQKTINKYYGFTLQKTNLSNGMKGKKKIMMMDRNLTDDEREQVYQLEQQSAKMGNPIQYRFINREKLLKFEGYFHVVAVQKEKAGSDVDKLMNNEKINQAAGIEKLSQGQVKANWGSLAEAVSLSWGDKDMFQTAAPENLGGPTAPEDAQTANKLNEVSKGIKDLEAISKTGIGAQLNEANNAQVRQPSMEQLSMQGQ